jgi:hypothetical protein
MPTYTTTLRLNDNIVSVTPLPASEFSLVRAYEYNSIGVAPNVLHARDKLQTPDGTDLSASAIFFETRVNNNSNPPIFTQQVIDGAFTGNEIKIHEYESFVTFSYPGIVDPDNVEDDILGPSPFNRQSHAFQILESPVQSEVKATVYEFIQTSSSITASDYTYQSAAGLWSPNQWASVKATGEHSGSKLTQAFFADSQDFRGYRSSSAAGNIITKSGKDTIYYNNRKVIDSKFDTTATLDVTVVDQGPPTPVGSKWVLDVKVSPAFVGTDGTPYYKKTIIVTDLIPAQSDNLPYRST